jgi:hypothetical protein
MSSIARWTWIADTSRMRTSRSTWTMLQHADLEPRPQGPRVSYTWTSIGWLWLLRASTSRRATIEVADVKRCVATFDARTPRLRCLHTSTSRVQPMDFEHCTLDVNYGHVLRADVEVEAVDAPTRRLGALATWPQSIEQLDVIFGAVATSSSRSRCTTMEVAM